MFYRVSVTIEPGRSLLTVRCHELIGQRKDQADIVLLTGLRKVRKRVLKNFKLSGSRSEFPSSKTILVSDRRLPLIGKVPSVGKVSGESPSVSLDIHLLLRLIFISNYDIS